MPRLLPVPPPPPAAADATRHSERAESASAQQATAGEDAVIEGEYVKARIEQRGASQRNADWESTPEAARIRTDSFFGSPSAPSAQQLGTTDAAPPVPRIPKRIVRNSFFGVDAHTYDDGSDDEDPLAAGFKAGNASDTSRRLPPQPGTNAHHHRRSQSASSVVAGGPPLVQPQPRRPFQFTDAPLTREPISLGPPGDAPRPSSFYGFDRHLPAPPGAQPGSSRELLPSSSRSSLRQGQGQAGARQRYSTHSEARGSRTYSDSRPNSVYRHYGSAGSGQHPVGGLDEFGNPVPALPTGPLLDHSHLKPGTKAKLLDYGKTLEMYRTNAKKTNDNDVMFEFACFLLDVVKEMEEQEQETELERERAKTPQELPVKKQQRRRGSDPPPVIPPIQTPKFSEKASLTAESIALLQKLANRGHVESQFALADCYSNGVGTHKGRHDHDKAFPLYVLAAKHGHVESAHRSGQCLEFAWGTKKEGDKALQFYKKAAFSQFPAAMYRMGLAEMNGELGLTKRPKEGVKWLKRAAETADESNPKPLYDLALLHEHGIDNVLFVDFDYATELLAKGADLKYAPSAYKLGECYEYGRMGCPQDSALSIHYYNIAAQQNHPEACFSLTAWYLVGSPGVLPQSDTEAFLWAKKAAELGLSKAMYAVGYFTEVGIGTQKDTREALIWFRKAAEKGDKRAAQRLRNGPDGAAATASSTSAAGPRTGDKSKLRRGDGEGGDDRRKNKEDCIVM